VPEEEAVVEIDSHWIATRRESRESFPPSGDAIPPKSTALRFAIGRASRREIAQLEEVKKAAEGKN
jgi:hypothetical protein